jgi:LysR family nitrogen assimilation transcriptional regulator
MTTTEPMQGRGASVDKHQPPIDFKQLAYFVALAEHGTISSAANALNMAQPSLSENIAKLEKRLDVQLAIRGVRGVHLTEAGVALAQRGREVLHSVDMLVEELRQISGAPRGRVSVGIPPSLSIFLSVPLLETIHSEQPEIRLHIAEAMSGDVLDWVTSERVDFGCAYELSDNASFSCEPLLTEELFLVTAPDNWEGEIGPDGVAVEPIHANRLQELPLVLTSGTHGARKMQEKFARSIGIDLNVVAEIDSLPHIVEMVGRASAYTLLSHGAVLNQVAAGTMALVRIDEPTMRRTAYIVRKRSRAVSRASLVVEACVKAIVQEMVERYKLKALLPSPRHGPALEPAAG